MWNPRPLAPSFRRFKCGVSYVGTQYIGWSAQVNEHPSGKRSVETVLQTAIRSFAGPEGSANFKGSSRTDLGVHALRNVFQVDLANARFTPDIIRQGLNHNIDRFSDEVVVTDVEEVDATFDATKKALARTYMYRILCPSDDTPDSVRSNLRFKRGGLFHRERAWAVADALDIRAMRAAGQVLLGEQDFSSFRNSGCTSSTPVRNVTHLKVVAQRLRAAADADAENGSCFAPLESQMLLDGLTCVTVSIRADAFLLKMVRNIVGVLCEVGRGNLAVDDMHRILRLRDRGKVKIPPAPAAGLYLVDVEHSL